MNTNGRAYQVSDSDTRICDILNATDRSYETVDSIPSVSRLTYANGFYVERVVAVFIDIRGSSQLPSHHTRPVLGKLYRAYLSECVAVLNQDPNCKQIFIQGDCVSGMFDGNEQRFVDDAFFRTCQLNALVNILNWRLAQKGFTTIQCGIGMAYGRALMLQGGCSGTGINEVIWMGDVVNEASKLCGQGNKNGRQPVQVSTAAYVRIGREDYRALLTPIVGGLLPLPLAYEGNPVSTDMDRWLTVERQKSAGPGLLSAITGYQGPLYTLADVMQLSPQAKTALSAAARELFGPRTPASVTAVSAAQDLPEDECTRKKLAFSLMAQKLYPKR